MAAPLDLHPKVVGLALGGALANVAVYLLDATGHPPSTQVASALTLIACTYGGWLPANPTDGGSASSLPADRETGGTP